MLGFLSEPGGGSPSNGRLAASFLVVFFVVAFPAGLWLPAQAAYVTAYSFKALEGALVLYLGTKVYDGYKRRQERVLAVSTAAVSTATPATDSAECSPELTR